MVLNAALSIIVIARIIWSNNTQKLFGDTPCRRTLPTMLALVDTRI
jgi:hypothetical protein